MTLITAAQAIASQDEILFVDTRPVAAWEAGTIPDSVSLNVYDYFIPTSDEEGIKGMVAGAKAAMAALGIDTAQRVVFFEDRTGMISPRGLWFYELSGFQNGAILDGGWQAWCSAGGARGLGARSPATISHGDAAQSGTFRRDLVTSTEEILSREGVSILDARRPAEWDGSYVHACCARAGRICDAHLLYFEDLLHEGHYRTPEEMRAIAAAAGFTPDQKITAYCHRGARAATALYGLRAAGFDNLSVYTGSWHEWAGDDNLPAVIGSGAYVHR